MICDGFCMYILWCLVFGQVHKALLNAENMNNVKIVCLNKTTKRWKQALLLLFVFVFVGWIFLVSAESKWIIRSLWRERYTNEENQNSTLEIKLFGFRITDWTDFSKTQISHGAWCCLLFQWNQCSHLCKQSWGEKKTQKKLFVEIFFPIIGFTQQINSILKTKWNASRGKKT